MRVACLLGQIIEMKLVKLAYIAAFVMALLVLISAWTDLVVLLPFALIPLFAGVGILRKRVWSAYGFVLYLSAQLLILPFVLLRSGGVATPGIIAQSVLLLLLIPLFFFAGRSLVAAGGQKGLAWPWIVVSVLTTVPLLFVQAFVIPTGAMEDTLLIGDRVLVRCFPKPDVERGDLIVFVYPIDRSQTYVKRVIGLPGESTIGSFIEMALHWRSLMRSTRAHTRISTPTIFPVNRARALCLTQPREC